MLSERRNPNQWERGVKKKKDSEKTMVRIKRIKLSFKRREIWEREKKRDERAWSFRKNTKQEISENPVTTWHKTVWEQGHNDAQIEIILD